MPRNDSVASKGAQTAYNKGVVAAKAGKPISACPYVDSPGAPMHQNFGRRWRRRWIEGYQSVKAREEQMPP
jgi:hypothetical protein